MEHPAREALVRKLHSRAFPAIGANALASMGRRSDQAPELQHMVEGVSVIDISY